MADAPKKPPKVQPKKEKPKPFAASPKPPKSLRSENKRPRLSN